MLDQYDGVGIPGQTSQSSLADAASEKKFAAPKVDPAAHVLASCMKAAGGHKLRKSSAGASFHEDDLSLPPPPPELLGRNASWTGTLSSDQPQSVDYAVPKCRSAAPVVPRRDPDTKLSSSSSYASAFVCPCGREETYESEGSHFVSYEQRRHPESGYITPDQETVDPTFLACLERSSELRMSQPSIQQSLPSSGFDMESVKKNAVLPETVFPQPPAEFGDWKSSPSSSSWQNPSENCSDELLLRNSNFSALNASVQPENSGDFSAYPGASSVLSRQSSLSVQNGQQSPVWEKPPTESDFHQDYTHSSPVFFSGVSVAENGTMSSVLPHLACIVPPPPPMETFPEADGLIKSSRSVSSTIGIAPRPLPPSSVAIFPETMQCGSEDFPSPTKLPPPPTFPKQAKKSLLSLESSAVVDPSPGTSAMPFKVNLKPVAAAKSTVNRPIENDETAVYAVPICSDFKHSASAADLYAGAARRSSASQEELHFGPSMAALSVTTDKNYTSLFHQRQEMESVFSDCAPPPPPPPLPPVLPADQKVSKPCSINRRSSLPTTAPVVPLKSWNAVQPPPPLPVAEFDSDSFGRSAAIASLSSALQSVRLQPAAYTTIERSNRSTTSSPLGGREALICQIQTGIQLRKSTNGAKIRQTSPTELVNVTNRSSSIGCCSSGENYLETGVQLLRALENSPPDSTSDMLMSQEMIHHSHSEVPIDVTKLPGYQEIPLNCPTWKQALIEKKNKQLEEDATNEILLRKQEEERWKDIPDWKRSLIIEKEKKKQEELAPYQAAKKRQEGEIERLQSLPEWKRNLIIKKRGDNA